jgi:hypothetical protein
MDSVSVNRFHYGAAEEERGCFRPLDITSAEGEQIRLDWKIERSVGY